MVCPYCGEGPVWRARFRGNGESIAICQECDTVWQKSGGTVKVTNYTAYAERLGQAPLWDMLALLSVIEGGKKKLWRTEEL